MADPAQKVVLVTGGTSGIGLALARAFRSDGARVVVCGRDAERLAEIRKALPDVTAIACDVSDRDQARRLIDQIAATHGRLGVLVNNAGLLKRQDFTGTPDFGMIEAEINTNLLAPINLTGLAMPLLRAAAPAWIVMITSGYALAPATRAPTYSATKAGLRAFAKALRRQVQPLGINVLEVIPGFVDTPAVAARPGRKIAPEEVAAATLAAMKRGRSQTTAGATRWLPLLLRLSPRLAENMVAKT